MPSVAAPALCKSSYALSTRLTPSKLNNSPTSNVASRSNKSIFQLVQTCSGYFVSRWRPCIYFKTPFIHSFEPGTLAMALSLFHQRRKTSHLYFVFFVLSVAAVLFAHYYAPSKVAVTTGEQRDYQLDSHHHNVSQVARRADPYFCTKNIPCHTYICCGSFFGGDTGTCGFGPTYCGSDCVSQCDAKSECGKDADPPVNCYRPGFQAACCTASTFANMIDACFVGCGEDKKENLVCPTGYTIIAVKCNPKLPSWLGRYFYMPICCPDASAFQGCHWIGKGTCDDNECDDNDVEVMLDSYGDSNFLCAGGLNGRRKVLCCNAPKNLNPFLPVDLNKIFPTLPPKTDYPQFDLQNLGSDSLPVVNKPNQQTFGLVVIDGPPETVSSLQHRDGSHMEVLSCDNISEDRPSTIRVVCMKSGPGSNCEIGGGIVSGTILRMPDGCGPGTYAVAHDMRPSLDQDLQYHLRRSAPENAVVHDLEISYDFTLTKRDSGDIYIRIDYSNSYDYWKQIVQGDPVTKRSGGKRLYSPKEDAWKSIYDTLRDDSRPGQGSLNYEHFNQLLVAEKGPDSCGNNSFMRVNVGGSITEKIKFGYSFVGIISPNFEILPIDFSTRASSSREPMRTRVGASTSTESATSTTFQQSDFQVCIQSSRHMLLQTRTQRPSPHDWLWSRHRCQFHSQLCCWKRLVSTHPLQSTPFSWRCLGWCQ